MNQHVVFACLLAPFLVAGCTNALSSPGDGGGDPDIFGLVIDQDGELLVGASVIIEGTGHAATTDERGEYAFHDVPYGERLHLVATYEGHHNQTADVQVGEFLAAQVVFTLIDLDAFPSHYITSFGGFFGCRIPEPIPCPFELDRPADAFTVDVPHSDRILQDALLELIWNPTPGGTDTLRIIAVGEDDGIEHSATGTSPVRLKVPHDQTLDVRVEPAGSFPYTANQSFTVYATHATVLISDGYSAEDGPPPS